MSLHSYFRFEQQSVDENHILDDPLMAGCGWRLHIKPEPNFRPLDFSLTSGLEISL